MNTLWDAYSNRKNADIKEAKKRKRINIFWKLLPISVGVAGIVLRAFKVI